MSNLGEWIFEQAYEKGVEKGVEKGFYKTIYSAMRDGLISSIEAADCADVTETEFYAKLSELKIIE